MNLEWATDLYIDELHIDIGDGSSIVHLIFLPMPLEKQLNNLNSLRGVLIENTSKRKLLVIT